MSELHSAPNLIIGLGGTGAKAVDLIRARLEEDIPQLAIDLDEPAEPAEPETDPEK